MNDENKEVSFENIPSSPENSKRYADHCLDLFFETSLENAKLLRGPENLLPVNPGELGEAIYFASTFEQVDQSRNEFGVIFKAFVKLGKSLIINNRDQIRNYSDSELQLGKYDSIHVTCLEGGDQYVIFNSTQILHIEQMKNSSIAEDSNSNRMIIEEPTFALHKSYSNITHCPYGNSCYNPDPTHIQKYHPFRPQPAGLYNHDYDWVSNRQEHRCPFKEKCYRQNLEHIRDYHPPGFKPAPKSQNTWRSFFLG